MALFSNKRNIKRAKEAAGQIQSASIRGMELADTEKARSIAAEQTKFSVLAALGTEGTYGPGATGTGGEGGRGSGEGIFNTSGEGLSGRNQSLGQYGNWANLEESGIRREGWNYSAEQEALLKERGTREGILDPEAYTREISKSPLFQMQSFQVAEAKQLLEREGPAWDRMEQSTLGVIHEGSALQLRDTMRRLKNNYAKGGTARRASMNEFQEIMAAQDAMTTRTQQTWQANLTLRDYVNKNFESVRNGSMKFVDALPGLNDAYRTSMLETSRLAVEATKTAALMAGNAYDLRMSQQAVNFGTKLVEGLVMAVAGRVSPALGMAVYKASSMAPGRGSHQYNAPGMEDGEDEGGLLGTAVDKGKELFGDALGSLGKSMGLGPQTAVSSQTNAQLGR